MPHTHTHMYVPRTKDTTQKLRFCNKVQYLSGTALLDKNSTICVALVMVPYLLLCVC